MRTLRDQAGMDWKTIAAQLGVAPTTAIYLYDCYAQQDTPACGPRRAIIATLAGPRVSELCALDNQDIDLTKSRLHIRDSKTQAGVRTLDIHPQLHDELAIYYRSRQPQRLDAPAFTTRNGTRRDKDNIAKRVLEPAVRRADQLRAQRHQPSIRTHVTPHTFRRTYITYLIAAGYDLPYVQAQVGHSNPTITLAVYAQLMKRANRDQLKAEIRALLDAQPGPMALQALPATITSVQPPHQTQPEQLHAEKAGKGRSLHR